MPQIILASSSPRRQNYFKELGVSFDIVSPNIDETPYKGEKPVDYVRRVSKEKVLEVFQSHKGSVIVAADTTVAVGRSILGKPESESQAADMLRLISGRRHQVLTSVCLMDEQGSIYEKTTKSTIKIKNLSEADIKRHVKNKENWAGKAGGYGIQTTAGGLLVQSLMGSYTGVVGLPLIETICLLRRCGVDV